MLFSWPLSRPSTAAIPNEVSSLSRLKYRIWSNPPLQASRTIPEFDTFKLANCKKVHDVAIGERHFRKAHPTFSCSKNSPIVSGLGITIVRDVRPPATLSVCWASRFVPATGETYTSPHRILQATTTSIHGILQTAKISPVAVPRYAFQTFGKMRNVEHAKMKAPPHARVQRAKVVILPSGQKLIS